MAKLYVLNGPQSGKSFELREGANYIGRSSADIEIEDPAVSRQHLKITVKRGRCYITDLGSRNHTFFNGQYLVPVLEYEAKEGIPIAIGLTVLCIEDDRREDMTFLLDSISVSREAIGKGGKHTGPEQRTDQNKLLMLYNVSDVLAQNLPVRVTCRKILDHILGLLKRIDRGVFVLINPATKEITETISKPDNIVGGMAMSYLNTIVQRVGSNGKPLVVSNVQMEKNDLADMLKRSKIESLLCVPMCSQSEIQGFLYIDSLKAPYTFRVDDVSLFMDLCQRIAFAISMLASRPTKKNRIT